MNSGGCKCEKETGTGCSSDEDILFSSMRVVDVYEENNENGAR